MNTVPINCALCHIISSSFYKIRQICEKLKQMMPIIHRVVNFLSIRELFGKLEPRRLNFKDDHDLMVSTEKNLYDQMHLTRQKKFGHSD